MTRGPRSRSRLMAAGIPARALSRWKAKITSFLNPEPAWDRFFRSEEFLKA